MPNACEAPTFGTNQSTSMQGMQLIKYSVYQKPQAYTFMLKASVLYTELWRRRRKKELASFEFRVQSNFI